jgi:hypothetical protein
LATDRDTPKYTGIRTYRDPGGRFEFRYPSNWHVHELADGRDGVMFSPYAENPETWFAVWATRLQDKVVAEDLDVLREGVKEGLSQLPGLNVESSSDDTFDNLCRFERVYTFSENGTVRKRKVWMLYVYKWLFVLVAQGATVDEYHYWSMMLLDFFSSFNLAPALWFASDRELADRVK